jgi:hypothetical protein
MTLEVLSSTEQPNAIGRIAEAHEIVRDANSLDSGSRRIQQRRKLHVSWNSRSASFSCAAC